MTGEAERVAVVERSFAARFGHPPSGLARAPGRVNLIGEHVDYNDGWVLPAAIERSVVLAFEPIAEPMIEISALDIAESVRLRVEDTTAESESFRPQMPRWARYPAGVAWALGQSGRSVGGLRAVFASTVPIGAGLSSSAAVEAAFALAWQAARGWPASKMDLARICQRAENEYVGVQCGLMDQFASLHGESGAALLLDCRSLAWEPVLLPAEVLVVVADSGVRRQLGASAYNTRRAECEQAVQRLRARLPGIGALRDVTPAEFNRVAEILPDTLRRRARHVVEECQRTLAMAAALRASELQRAGELLDLSHESLRTLYEVSGPELDTLVETARAIPGCYGARLTGGGFGGCTVQLVAAAQARDFSRTLSEEYARVTGRLAEVMITKPAQGARLLRQPGG